MSKINSPCGLDASFPVGFTKKLFIGQYCFVPIKGYFSSSNIAKVQGPRRARQFLCSSCSGSILKWLHLCQLFTGVYVRVCILDSNAITQKVTGQDHSRIRDLKAFTTKCVDLIWLLIRINQLKKLCEKTGKFKYGLSVRWHLGTSVNGVVVI